MSHAREYDEYIHQPTIDVSEDPLEYWKNEGRFPNIKKIVPKYLCIMGTSVPSERLFSQAANILTPRRNRITPENLKKFFFLSKYDKNDWNLSRYINCLKEFKLFKLIFVFFQLLSGVYVHIFF